VAASTDEDSLTGNSNRSVREIFATNSIITANSTWRSSQGADIPRIKQKLSPRKLRKMRGNEHLKFGRPDVRFADTLERQNYENEQNAGYANPSDHHYGMEDRLTEL
jgi:urease accessory protein UreF